MRQRSFSGGFEKYHKSARKGKFLDERDQVIPRARLMKAFARHYPDPKPQQGFPFVQGHLVQADARRMAST